MKNLYKRYYDLNLKNLNFRDFFLVRARGLMEILDINTHIILYKNKISCKNITIYRS